MPPGSSSRTAVFYSTLRNWGWGAPDYVWPIAAGELLRRGHSVIAVVRCQIVDHPILRDLVAQGAQIFLQPPLVYRRGRISQLKELYLRLASSTRPLRLALQGAAQPHFIIEQSGSFDFLDETLLHQFIEETRATYDVVFRSNCYAPPLSAALRAHAITFLESAQRTIFNSQWTRELTEVQLVHRLGNARFLQHLVRFPNDAPLAWPEDRTIRLASVSRIDAHHKGLDALLQALAQLPSSTPDWTLDVYGQGPDEDYLRELAAWLGVGQRVQFHARVDDIRNIWRECHLLLLVSRYEGLAVSMLEAMACGRPVLRTPYGGCAEWIVPGENGFICPAPEPSLIAETLHQAIQRFADWPAMGRAAHQRIQTHLTPRPEAIFLDPFEL